MVLTREEKERLVLDLYNQGKSTREIAEEARMSFRDIGVIWIRRKKRKRLAKSKQKKCHNQHKPTNYFPKANLQYKWLLH